MCGYAVSLLDFDELTEAQKKALLKSYQRKKKAFEAQLKDINDSLKDINQALKVVEKKSTRRAKRAK
jgi:hypothetical protein